MQAVKRFAIRLGLAALVVLVAYVGWKLGDAVFPRLETAVGIDEADESAVPEAVTPEAVTPEAADLAMKRIESFRASEDAVEMRLRPAEVSALLRYALTGMLPRGVTAPAVKMEGDRIELLARVVAADFPDLPGPGGIAGAVVPDTVAVSVGGSLAPFGDRGSMLLVSRIVVGGIPIPSSAFPDILGALGRTHEDGLPATAVLAPAFKGIKGAYVEAGELVLVRP